MIGAYLIGVLIYAIGIDKTNRSFGIKLIIGLFFCWVLIPWHLFLWFLGLKK